MTRRTQAEMRALLGSEDFRAWWAELAAAHEALRAIELSHQQVAREASLARFRAEFDEGEAEDALYGPSDADALAGEAGALESRAFEAGSAFEAHQARAQAAWARLAQAELDGDPGRVAHASEEHRREKEQQVQRWAEIEDLWARSAVLRAAEADRRAGLELGKRRVELRFQKASAESERAQGLENAARRVRARRDEALAHVEAVMRAAGARFECATGQVMLFFAHAERQRSMWCVPTVAEQRFGAAVEALALYEGTLVDGALTLAFIADPAAPPRPAAPALLAPAAPEQPAPSVTPIGAPVPHPTGGRISSASDVPASHPAGVDAPRDTPEPLPPVKKPPARKKSARRRR